MDTVVNISPNMDYFSFSLLGEKFVPVQNTTFDPRQDDLTSVFLELPLCSKHESQWCVWYTYTEL